MHKRNNKVHIFFIVLLLAIFILREIDYISKKSETYDEHYHISRGYPTLITGDYRLRGYNVFLVPFLSAIPLFFNEISFSKDNKYWEQAALTRHSWDFALDFFYRNKLAHEKILIQARLVIIFISLFLLLLIYLFSKELYGITTAVVVLFFASFSPNILAHAGIVSEDLPLAFFMFSAVYFF